jgi:hypothetical protein
MESQLFAPAGAKRDSALILVTSLVAQSCRSSAIG